jgi:hypothetical protein
MQIGFIQHGFWIKAMLEGTQQRSDNQGGAK